MNIRSCFSGIYWVALCLFALSFGVQLTPVALAQAGPNRPSDPSAGATLFLPLALGGDHGGGGGSGSDTGSLWLPYTLDDVSILPTYGASVAVDS